MYNTIGIMGAMPEEIKNIFEKLAEKSEVKLGGNTFYKGKLNGKDVVLVCAGMGKVNAAAAAQLLITSFGANAILFSGIAGNMTSKISVGDVVIGKTVEYHDAQNDMICQAYPNLEQFTSDEKMMTAAQKACEELRIKYIVGKIATGDLFVGDSATKNAIAAKCAPDCVEMEGAAVAHIAAKNDTPFVIVRAMSDDSDEDAHEKLVGKPFDISEYCETAAQISEKILENLAK